MDAQSSALESLERDGACLWPDTLGMSRLGDLESCLGGGPLLERRPIELGALRAWLGGTFLPGLATRVLGPGAQAVRALLMGKSGEENWAIAFHQDTTLALRAHREVPGFGPWVNKAHFYQAQAPASVMEGMLATRIHLDDCGPENGPLTVIPGSHRAGKLDAAAIVARVAMDEALTLCADRGEVVLMRPLTLHGSHQAASPAPRRVLHVEWTAAALPGGLAWAWF